MDLILSGVRGIAVSSPKDALDSGYGTVKVAIKSPSASRSSITVPLSAHCATSSPQWSARGESSPAIVYTVTGTS